MAQLNSCRGIGMELWQGNGAEASRLTDESSQLAEEAWRLFPTRAK